MLPYLNDTERTIHHARFAEKAGAAAVMTIPMSYWKLTDDEIFQHFDRIANAISIPIMAYNNPATAGTDMRPEFLARLLKIPNVTMIKESTGDTNRLHRLVQVAGEEVAFFNGSNPVAFYAFAAGATGWCTAAANLIPSLNIQLYEAVCNRNGLKVARTVFRKQLPVLQFLVTEGLLRSVAAGLQLDGIAVGPLRAPLESLPADKLATLAQLLSQARMYRHDCCSCAAGNFVTGISLLVRRDIHVESCFLSCWLSRLCQCGTDGRRFAQGASGKGPPWRTTVADRGSGSV